MRKTMKRWMAALLSLALVLGMAGYFAVEKMDAVEAAEEAIAEYGTYVWETLAYESSDKAPICATEGYFFAGYYEDDKTTPVRKPEVGVSYQAKFVPDDVLTVKCQTATTVDKTGATPADVRLITTVDSLNYATVGFRLKTETKDQKFPLTGVMRKITADNGAGAYGYSPNIFDLASKYYATATFTGIGDHNKAFFVEPYWVTLDGTEVTGISRYMRISDAYAANPNATNGNQAQNGYVNIPVYLNSADDVVIGAGTTITIDKKKHNVHNGATVEADGLDMYVYKAFDAGDIFAKEDITVTSSGTQIIITINEGVEAEAAKGLLVNLRFQTRFSYTNTSFQSRYMFEMTASDANIKVCDHLQRNLMACGTADKAVMCGTDAIYDDVIVIATVAEFKGMQAYLAGNSHLNGCTVLLAADVDLNPTWTANATAPSVKYAPGSWDFNATFDGQDHTIRGLYIDNADREGGMFKNIGATGTVKNFTLDNCYAAAPSGKRGGLLGAVIQGTVENVVVKNSTISSVSSATGAFCGDLKGTLNDIKVMDCTVTSAGNLGGIAGNLGDNATISTAYCDATVTCTAASPVGGIAAKTSNANNVTITDTWYAGKVSGTKQMGGIIGTIENTDITISHCQNSGEVEYTAAAGTGATASGGIGGIVGFMGPGSAGKSINISDSMNISKLTNENNINTMLMGSIFGQIYAGKDPMIISSTYGVSTFRNMTTNTNYASGWPRTGYRGNGSLTINGATVTTNYTADGYTSELDLLFNRATGVPTLDLSYDKGDGSDYWWIRTGNVSISRLASFADMPWKQSK